MSSYAKLNNLCNPQSNLGTDYTIFLPPNDPIYHRYRPNIVLVDDSKVNLKDCNQKPLCPGTDNCKKTCK